MPITYLKGTDDIYFVAFSVLCFLLLRECAMRFLFVPLGRWAGVSERTNLLRFGEQGYDVLFHAPGWLCGFWIMQKSEYRNLNLAGLWKDYPHFRLGWEIKAYYLIQSGFWIAQIITLNIEKRRKDYLQVNTVFYPSHTDISFRCIRQMFTHHLITCSLLGLSYHQNWTRIGNVILMLMDPADIMLAAAKMLKYVHLETACNVQFGVFMLTWVGTRHVLYPMVLWSVIHDPQKYIDYTWRPEKELFFTHNVQRIFTVLLGMLQILLVLWFLMIAKVAAGVLMGKGAEDTRSDDEG